MCMFEVSGRFSTSGSCPVMTEQPESTHLADVDALSKIPFKTPHSDIATPRHPHLLTAH